MAKPTFTLAEVNDLELSAADNATILERERIIKLLEDETWDGSISPFLHNRRVEREWTIRLIALIKGETNG